MTPDELAQQTDSSFEDARQAVLEETRQCPTCGHCKEDWSERVGPVKGKKRADYEDRTKEYGAWRGYLGKGMYQQDIDCVEYRYINGVVTPVATLELTRVDGNHTVRDSYRASTIKRYREEGQRNASYIFAERLGVNCYIVLFRWDLTDFWLYNLTKDLGWKHFDLEQYERWIRTMPH